MNKKITIIGCILWGILLGFTACKDSPQSKYQELDLLSYGMPIIIKAPSEVEVEKEDFGVMTGITVKGEGYDIQIYSGNTNTLDIGKIKSEKLTEVKLGRYFSKIIEEEDDGFIFEKDIDGEIRFDFRHIKIVGDKEFTFQKGLIGNYSESEIRNMYEAVK